MGRGRSLDLCWKEHQPLCQIVCEAAQDAVLLICKVFHRRGSNAVILPSPGSRAFGALLPVWSALLLKSRGAPGGAGSCTPTWKKPSLVKRHRERTSTRASPSVRSHKRFPSTASEQDSGVSELRIGSQRLEYPCVSRRFWY